MAQPVQLRRRSDGHLVDAELVSGVRAEDLVDIESEWLAERDSLRARLNAAGVVENGPDWPGSLHWDWSGQAKAGKLRFAGTRGCAIRCDGRWQGVVLCDDASHFAQDPSDQGKSLVYIDYIESAPWNWKLDVVGQQGEYKSVGARLFAVAVGQSQNEGYHGRVGLHALPQAEPTYQEWGLSNFGPDARYGGLTYFELNRNAATHWGKTE